jgi:hypothetical protein
MEIDRAETLIGQQPDKFINWLIEPLGLADGLVKDTLVKTLQDIVGSPTGKYTLSQMTSTLSKSYDKTTKLLRLEKGDKEFKLTMHNGVDIKTARISAV